MSLDAFYISRIVFGLFVFVDSLIHKSNTSLNVIAHEVLKEILFLNSFSSFIASFFNHTISIDNVYLDKT